MRATSVFVVINLTWKENNKQDTAALARIQQFQNFGVVEKLKAMMQNDKELEVRDRARQCLDNFA